MFVNMHTYRLYWVILLLPAIITPALAGPPFKTDDPQPVDFHHWEFYIASEQQFTGHESDATCPHIEINYGALANIQVHIVVPLGYSHTSEGTHYGFSDTELGMKYRFIEETDSSPQIGSFPLIEVPTGNENNQLGAGHIQAYLPLWIQKTWGKLTTYGGGGVWFSTGPGRGHWIFTGWELQYDFSEWITLGNEFYFQTAETQSAESSTGFNFGGNINITERHHVLFSVGRTFSGEMSVTGYIGYQLTI